MPCVCNPSLTSRCSAFIAGASQLALPAPIAQRRALARLPAFEVVDICFRLGPPRAYFVKIYDFKKKNMCFFRIVERNFIVLDIVVARSHFGSRLFLKRPPKWLELWFAHGLSSGATAKD